MLSCPLSRALSVSRSLNHTTHTNESWYTREWSISHIWVFHVTAAAFQQNQTHQWVMAHTQWVMWQIWLSHMGWLRLVGFLKLYVSFVTEPYKRDDILQKRHAILRSLLIVATPYHICCFPTKPHAQMSHGTRKSSGTLMNESCQTYKWVLSQHEWVMSHTHMNESCRTSYLTCSWVMPHISRSLVTHTTCRWDMSPTYKCVVFTPNNIHSPAGGMQTSCLTLQQWGGYD